MLPFRKAPAKRRRRAARNRNQHCSRDRLRIEYLEARYLLATITVTDLNDDTLANLAGDGQISLREAIEAANTDTSVDGSTAGSGADTVEFAAGLIGTIDLADGEFAVTDDLTIIGLSEFILSIDAQQNSRIFNIDDGNSGNLLDVEISGLTLAGGDVTGNGGAIVSQENLTLRDSRVTGNTASARGGGLYVHTFNGGTTSIDNTTIDGNSADDGGGLFGSTNVGGTLMVTNSTITGNTAQTDGGGFNNYNFGTASVTGSTISSNNANNDGGGVYSINAANGTTTIDDTVIASNRADADLSGGGDGGGVWAHRDLTIASATVSGNTANGGGGVYWDSDSSFDALLIDETTISDNTAGGGHGGGLLAEIDAGSTATVQDSTIADNKVTANFRSGGGVRVNGTGSLSIQASTITGNSATTGNFGIGGGIQAYADTTVTDSTISNNFTSYSGGGIASVNSDLTVIRTTIAGNTVSSNGGGILSNKSLSNTTTIVNSTISGNTADGAPGTSTGGGIRTTSGVTRIFNSTITNNTSDDGAGVASQGNAATTETEVRSSIIAGNNGDDVDFVVQASNTFTSLDHNVIGTGNATGAFNQTNDQVVGAADPGLAPLGVNGGPTETHALFSTSVAVDAGSNPDTLAADQRGVVREFGAGPDAGAFELGFVVTTANDEFNADGNRSLREALFDADNSPGMDDISFDPSLAGQLFDLTLGQLQIDDGVIIRGLGQEVQTIDAQQNSRIFDVDAGNFDVEIIGLTLTGGQSPAGEDGGAIRFGHFGADNTGTLRIDSSTISGNSADEIGGGINTYSGSVSVSSSTISGNTAAGGVGGGGILTGSGSVRVTGSTISDNLASQGGGIRTLSGSVSIAGSTISDNSASPLFGASTRFGGGIRTTSGSVSVTNSTISGNSATHGGGLSTSSGLMNVTSSTISGNSANTGGGVYAGSNSAVHVSRSTINGNTATVLGGGIWARSLLLHLDKVEISGNAVVQPSSSNSSVVSGGGIRFDRLSGGTLVISNSTIVGNLVQARDRADGEDAVAGVGDASDGIDGIDARGGGLRVTRSGPVAQIINSTISGNTVRAGAGGRGGNGVPSATSSEQDGADGGAGGDAQGGGLHLSGESVALIVQSTISGNRVISGIGGAGGYGAGGGDGGAGGDAGRSQGGGVFVDSFLAPTVTNPDAPVVVDSPTFEIEGTGDGAGTLAEIFTDENNNTFIDGSDAMVGQEVLGSDSVFDIIVPLAQDAVNNFLVRLVSVNGDETRLDVPTITEQTGAGAPATPVPPVLFNGGTSLAVVNSTVSVNSADGSTGGLGGSGTTAGSNGSNSNGEGGGLFSTDTGDFGGDAEDNSFVSSSIIAGNTSTDGPDALASIEPSNSLIGDNQDTGLTASATPDGNGNIIGGPAVGGAINAKLSPLGNNGGLTQTHALFPTSPAINLGAANGQTADQRGAPRDNSGGADMGAFELHQFFVVNSTGDGGDSNLGDNLCNDGTGNCTLRAAIQQANATANVTNALDMIYFNIPGAGPHTIQPLSSLPAITEPVVIDGTSEPDFGGTTPVIEIDGSGAGAGVSGVTISAGDSTVRGLAINQFNSSGIRLLTGGGNTIQQNMIGTNPAGTTDLGNGGHGVLIFNSANNLIGGSTSAERNVISGNTLHGVYITRAASANNNVKSNIIGLGSNGITPIANSGAGVRIDQGASDTTIGGSGNVISGNAAGGVVINGSATSNNTLAGNQIGTDITGLLDRGNIGPGVLIDNAPNNTIGVPGDGNTISGNNADGVFITGGSASGNVLQANNIGVDANGNTALQNNQSGVTVNEAPNNTIGGTAAGAGNVISGNNKSGVFIVGNAAFGNKVESNFIGTKGSGTAAVANKQFGVVVREAPNNTVGGTASGAGNVISGNTFDGVAILLEAATGNVVAGNKIGTDPTGTADVGNVKSGVLIWRAPGNTVGGTTAAARNIISGNDLFGVRISTATADNSVIQGNYIGTDVTGTLALPNSDSGVQLANAQNATIGGSAAGAGNVISGNGNHGVLLTGAGVLGNMVQGNIIGLDVTGASAIGNTNAGVRISSGAHDNTIGGDSTAGEGNVISANGSDGVFLVNATTRDNAVAGNRIGTDHTGTVLLGNSRHGVFVIDAVTNTIGGTSVEKGNRIAGSGQSGVVIFGAATENAIQSNSIFENTALGIDLGLDGVTANDANDPDSGPNKLQNFPVLQTAVLNGGNLDITYSVPSIAPNSTFPLTVEFFLADAPGQEGQTFLGSDSYAAGTTPTATVPHGGAVAGNKVVATATDANGNTSEFSANVTVSVPLLAASEPLMSAEACRAYRGDSPVDAAELEILRAGLPSIIDAAVIRWQQAGIDAKQLALLNNLDIQFAELDGAYLGLTTGNTILLDTNAAGYGWFIDPTPLDDSEYPPSSRPSPLDPGPSSLDSRHRMDLLTAVMHEMGHVLGLEDLIDDGFAEDVMSAALQVGHSHRP